ncbi:histone-fold-containing protein [Melampsora americana]|nr:histone-fold-containing protein [Melampsora americana]
MTSILPKPSSRTRKPIEELQSTSNSNQTHQITSDQKTTTTTHTPSMMIKEDEIQTYNLTHQLLPHSNIHKLMKQSLPIEIKISNSSKSLIQSCVSEFLIFILSHSNSLLSSSTTTTTSSSSIKRKTINGLDLLESLKHLGFWGYFNVLKIYLIKYRSSK